MDQKPLQACLIELLCAWSLCFSSFHSQNLMFYEGQSQGYVPTRLAVLVWNFPASCTMLIYKGFEKVVFAHIDNIYLLGLCGTSLCERLDGSSHV